MRGGHGRNPDSKYVLKGRPSHNNDVDPLEEIDREAAGPIVCFKCQEKGHISRDCPNKKSGGRNNADP